MNPAWPAWPAWDSGAIPVVHIIHRGQPVDDATHVHIRAIGGRAAGAAQLATGGYGCPPQCQQATCGPHAVYSFVSPEALNSGWAARTHKPRPLSGEGCWQAARWARSSVQAASLRRLKPGRHIALSLAVAGHCAGLRRGRSSHWSHGDRGSPILCDCTGVIA